MKDSLTSLIHKLVILLCLFMMPAILKADQETYLSQSPNGRYRVLVEQVLYRRVVNHVFFRYPIILQNIQEPYRYFETVNAGPCLVHETPNQTFYIQWDDNNPPAIMGVRFDWAPDSLKYFMHLEVLKGIWKTYFVDVRKGQTTDITADLESALSRKVDFHNWDCQAPTFRLVKWIKPYLAFFRLTSICAKSQKKENPELFYQNDSVLFDTQKVKVVDHCANCSDPSSVKDFNSYYLKSLPTATPTAQDTPSSD